MEPEIPQIIAALKHARDLIIARGYQPHWGGEGALNISNALGRSTETYELYCAARQAFSALWGGPLKEGLLSWETYKRRTLSEVIELFGQVIERLENGEAKPKGPANPSGAASSSRVRPGAV